jgi:hypothetical protein
MVDVAALIAAYDRERTARLAVFHGLAARAREPLWRAGYRDPGRVAAASDAELLAVTNIGPSMLAIIRAWQGAHGHDPSPTDPHGLVDLQ